MSYENFEEKYNKDGITDDHRYLKCGKLVGYFKKNGKQYFQNIYGEICDVSMMNLYGHDAVEMEVYGY